MPEDLAKMQTVMHRVKVRFCISNMHSVRAEAAGPDIRLVWPKASCVLVPCSLSHVLFCSPLTHPTSIASHHYTHTHTHPSATSAFTLVVPPTKKSPFSSSCC